jgi:hypothetical protein
MSNTQINYAVAATTVTQPKATALADLAAIPIDFTLPNFWGLLLTADSTTNPSGTTVERVLTFKMVPTVGDATATATLVGGSSGSSVKNIAVTGAGGLYARPPVLTFTGGGNPLKGAVAFAQMQVGGTIAVKGGTGYSGATVAAFVGGELATGGTPAVAGAVTVVGNAVTAVAVATPGGPYNVPPTVVITDSGGGSGAEVIAGLSVASVNLVYGGVGYTSAPTVVFTPLFKQMVPDTSNQPSTIIGLMIQAVQNTLKIPCLELCTAT